LVNFRYSSEMDLVYEKDGHRHLRIPVFYESGSNSNNRVDFIIDTGAYLTVLTRIMAKEFDFDKLTPLSKNVPLTGFAGYRVEGDLIEIPMLLGGKRIAAKVVVPYVDTADNILGLNVLEHFNYLIDSTNDKIYFTDNPVYKANQNLMSSNIWAMKDDS